MLNNRFETLPGALAVAPPERPFVTMWENEDEVTTVSFGEFRELAAIQAQHLRRSGLRAGERVVFVMPQGIPLMATFTGAMVLGAVPAILAYPNFKTDPVKYASGLAGVLANLNAPLVVVDNSATKAMLSRHLPSTANTRVTCGAPAKTGGNAELPDPSVDGSQLAFLQHSSGTTGLQKGVALSHAAVLRQVAHLADALKITEADCIYSWLPLYHDMGLIACFILPLVRHLHVVMQSPASWVAQPRTMMELITAWRCSLAWVPNFALQFLARRVRREDRAGYDVSSLRALINCSEPVRAQSIDEFVSIYETCGLKPNAVHTSYAMAENVFAVTQSNVETGPRRLYVDRQRLFADGVAIPAQPHGQGGTWLVSSGALLSNQQVRIVDSDGTDRQPGSVGEIAVSGDCLFDGYYGREDLTASVLRDGWYYTGDLGFQVDGELYVIGRNKDLIIVAGKNIYPHDVEHIVCNHPSIQDGRAIAFGMPNSSSGTEDIIVVAEVSREEDLSQTTKIENALRDAVVAELDVAVRAIYLKPPKWIVKSTAGKAARAITRQKLLQEQPELAGADRETAIS
jgi:acyl-CoA synthetase (AMP-forming)/AMP-acid ligase II